MIHEENEAELNHTVPIQYKKLFDLLSEYSEKYHAETGAIFKKLGRKWNPLLSRFEIDTFFFSLLSFSICRARQNMDVIKGVQMYIFESLLQNFNIQDALGRIIEIRVKHYCKFMHELNSNNKKWIDMEILDEVLTHIKCVSEENNIDENCGMVIGDVFESFELKSMMFPMHVGISGEFSCCLKHLFRASLDIRSLSLEKMDSLIENGRKEAVEILSELDLSKIADSLSANNLIKRLLEEGAVTEDYLLQMSDSKLVRKILEKRIQRKEMPDYITKYVLQNDDEAIISLVLHETYIHQCYEDGTLDYEDETFDENEAINRIGGFTVVDPQTAIELFDDPQKLENYKKRIREDIRIREYGDEISNLIDELFLRNKESVRLSIKSSPKDGYIIDYDGTYAKYLEECGWREWHKGHSEAHGFTTISLPAYDKKSGFVLIYQDITSDDRVGLGTLNAYRYKDGKLESMGDVELWVS
jgi:hypothetical protein